ncbi:MAG: hypothetical protein E5X34_13055 [Mesorhizobium sp.]|uniref:hypothetical protein n=1 Tax=Mesorhizobium sp. TaxID=1871066 RepID=UPI0011FC340F|nr:hypothetical protein [Mesorhizobium sp.]TIR23978.1 MAG: hypothetical protein E5X34_13055 [Mesorhizobium sp.]
MAEAKSPTPMSHTDVRRAAHLIEVRGKYQRTLDGLKTVTTINGLNNAAITMDHGDGHAQKWPLAHLLRELDVEEQFGNKMIELLLTVAAGKIGEINAELKNLGVAT